MQPFVYTFKINRETGKLRELFKTATLDKKTEFLGKPFERHSVFEPLDHGAEIQLHPNKRWLYTSHRNKGSIIAFEVDELGCLERFQVICIIQSTLGFATMGLAANLALATSIPMTDLRQYINSDLVFSDLKLQLLYSK